MLLIEKIKADMWEAKRNKQPVDASLLNILLSEAAKIGKDNGNRQSTDQEVVATVKKFLKNNDETLKAIGDSDSKAKELVLAEKDILNRYLPQQLSRKELEAVILGYNAKTEGKAGVSGIMKFLKENYAGSYSGQDASEIAKGL